jgi:hypothetical protein
MKRTQKQLIEDVQQSEKIGEALAELTTSVDTGSIPLDWSAKLLNTVLGEIYFLKEEELSND